jgi:RNA polymerase sigma factor (sigma-70 family)
MTGYDNDDQLADAVQSGDIVAQDAFFNRFQEPLIKWARHWGFQYADADDLAQETLVVGFMTISSFRRGEALNPWLVGILENMMKRKWNEQKRTKADVLDETTEEGDAVFRLEEPTSPAEIQELARLHAHAELLMVIAYNDPKNRRYLDAVRLRLDGLKYKDIEQALRLGAGSGKVYVSRGVKILKEMNEMPVPEDPPRAGDR